MSHFSQNCTIWPCVAGGVAAGVMLGVGLAHSLRPNWCNQSRYTTPDQPARFAASKAANDPRVMDIDQLYDPSSLKGKRVAVTGANRGIGLALAQELTAIGAHVVAICRSNSQELIDLNPAELHLKVDVTSDEDCSRVAALIKAPIDVLINNAGYFYGPEETLDKLAFDEELKMIDICAVGPLRISAAMVNAKKMAAGSKIVMITSQGGSISWRTVQNPTGHDYGHHMSKAAANMMSVLLSQELKGSGIPVGILHPGFNKTDMTSKYSHIWEIEGAVNSSVGAKRVLHEVTLLSMKTTGKFINCEDGLEIPW